MTDGRTLEELIGREDFARAVEQLSPIGLERQFVNRLKPWVVLLNLRAPGSADAPTMDAQLVAAARERRLPVEPLEGVEEQVFAFDGGVIGNRVMQRFCVLESALRFANPNRDDSSLNECIDDPIGLTASTRPFFTSVPMSVLILNMSPRALSAHANTCRARCLRFVAQ